MSNFSPAVNKAFELLAKQNPEASFLSESALSNVPDFIDTGSYALNAIISGSLFKGIPTGRILGLTGPSGCGKTLILNKIIANAQKKGRFAVVWDSEIAIDMQSAKNVGCDPTKYKHVPIGQIEQTRNEIVGFLDFILANPELKGKFIIGVDSLANLASAKEEADAGKGKDATDMGLRAKALKSMFRTITYKCAKADCPMIFTNHIYDDPMAMYGSIKKNMSGGKGPEYMASVLVQFNATQTKDESEHIAIAKTGKGGQVSGITMSALTVKNRFLPPFLETELTLNFLTGLSPYAGLYDLVTAYEVLEGTNSFTLPDGEKIGTRSKWENDPAVWAKILPLLEAKLSEKFKFNASAPLEEDVDEDDEPESEE